MPLRYLWRHRHDYPRLAQRVCRNLTANVPDTPPAGFDERRKVPAGTSGDAAYASSRADELAPRGEPPYAEVATCTHGYTRCMPCKFPAP
jgi:hypothetical protein